MNNIATPEKPKGRGHTVTVNIGGKKRNIPWGFKTPVNEGKAAKARAIEYPGTSRKD